MMTLISAFAFLFVVATPTHANPCDDLEDKPALAVLQDLKKKDLLGIGEAAIENEITLNQIFNENKAYPRRQLQYAFTLIRSLRDQASVYLGETFQQSRAALNERWEQDAIENDLTTQLYAPPYTEDELIALVRTSPALKIYDRTIMDQILKFKDQYFSSDFVTAIRTESLYTENVIVAATHETRSPFTIRMNINGKRHDFTFGPGKLSVRTEEFTVKANQLATWASVPPEHNGVPIYFYSIQITKR